MAIVQRELLVGVSGSLGEFATTANRGSCSLMERTPPEVRSISLDLSMDRATKLDEVGFWSKML